MLTLDTADVDVIVSILAIVRRRLARQGIRIFVRDVGALEPYEHVG